MTAIAESGFDSRTQISGTMKAAPPVSRWQGQTQSAFMERIMSKTILTQARLKELLNYDPETGVLMWISSNRGRRSGEIAGYIKSGARGGYRRLELSGNQYPAHRLAWLYVYGQWPTQQIDHVNGVRDDNRIANLREVSPAENQHNQKKARGYSRHNNSWVARIMVGWKLIHLGCFLTESEARAAYLAAKRIYHPTSPII